MLTTTSKRLFAPNAVYIPTRDGKEGRDFDREDCTLLLVDGEFTYGEVVYEYVAGNCQKESTAIIDPSSTNAVKLSQLRRWAKQTADQIAEKRGIPTNQIEYDPDLETPLGAIPC